jgi:hypothetical protein
LPGMSVLAEGQWDRRLLGYVEILLPLFAIIGCFSIIIYAMKKKKYVRRVAICLITGFIAVASLQSIVSLYPSPFVSDGNNQITHMNLTGTKWFLEKKDINVGSRYILSNLANYATGVIGYKEASDRGDIHAYENYLPDHFGYPASSTLGTDFPADKYAAITKLDRTVYSTVWESVGRFNDADFERLESDTSVSKLYSNSEMDIYYVRAQ